MSKETATLSVRIETKAKRKFEKNCVKTGRSMALVTERMVEEFNNNEAFRKRMTKPPEAVASSR